LIPFQVCHAFHSEELKMSREIRKLGALAAGVIGGIAFVGGASAAIVGTDVASNSPPYTSGSGNTASTEFNGLNGGSGYGAWSVTDTENYTGAGATTSSSTGNGGAFDNTSTNDATRNPAPVFDVYDNGNPNSSTATGAALGSSIEAAIRPFNTPLTGQGSSFSFIESLASLRAENSGAQTCQLGFELLDASGDVLLNLYTYGGASGFYAQDASNSGNPYLLFSTDAAHSGSSSRALTVNTGAADTLTITLNDNSGDYTISSVGHEGSTFADGGQINMSTGGPAAFEIYNNNGGDGSDMRVNSLIETVVPEPASIALGAMGVFGLMLRRRRS
jgi:hypothetical protein